MNKGKGEARLDTDMPGL